MLKKILLIGLFFPLLAFAGVLRHESCEHRVEVLGKKVLFHLWKDLKASNAKAISKYMSPQFQGVTPNEARNKCQQLAFIKSRRIPSYVLSQIKVTETKGILIITYIAKVQEIINNTSVFSTARRLTVFKKIDGKWMWIAQARTG